MLIPTYFSNFALPFIRMKTIQKTGILFLLLVFLFGTTGITIYQHICSGKPGKEITIYPEYFSKHSDCCCGEEGFSSRNKTQAVDHQEISDSECCRNISLFLKVSIISIPVTFSQTEIIIPVLVLPETFFPVVNIQTACISEYAGECSKSPPLSGKQRILLFHQSKTISIPDHLS